MKRSRFYALVAMLVFAGLVISGCAAAPSSSRNAKMEAEYGFADGAPMPAGTMMPAAAEAPRELVKEMQYDSAGAPALQQRMIIHTAYLALIVQDTAAVMDQIRALVEATEGYVAGSNAYYAGEQLRGSMNVRVPANQMNQVLEQIKGLAVRVQNENTDGQDVTEEFTDLSSRLLNLEATEAELRELLTAVRERTGKAEDIMAVYRELTQIRGEIEQTKGRMQYLQRLTALATINIELIPSELEKPLVAQTWDPTLTLRNAFRSLLDAGQVIVDAGIYLLVVGLPLLVLVLIPIVVFVWLVRRAMRRRRAAV